MLILIKALSLIVFGLQGANGDMKKQEPDLERVEFSKIKTEAFVRNCTGR